VGLAVGLANRYSKSIIKINKLDKYLAAEDFRFIVYKSVNECKSLCHCSALQILPLVHGLAVLVLLIRANLLLSRARNTAARTETEWNAGRIVVSRRPNRANPPLRTTLTLPPLAQSVKPEIGSGLIFQAG
jgi:hypothetical protein